MAEERMVEQQEREDEQLIINQDLTTEVAELQGKAYLTINGIRRLAIELGLSITEIVRSHTDTEWDYEARATDKEGNHRWGACTEPKKKQFSKSMAINKAQRNAFNSFLSKHPRVETAIENYKSNKSTNPSQRNTRPPPQPPRNTQNVAPPKPTPLTVAKTDALEALRAKLPDLLELGTNEATFWEHVKFYFGCTSSTQMTIVDWKEVKDALTSEETPAWVREKQAKVIDTSSV